MARQHCGLVHDRFEEATGLKLIWEGSLKEDLPPMPRFLKPDRLALIDAKTGPRHVLLGEAARELLNRLAETASGEWVFPGDNGDGPLSTDDLWRFWIKARDAAGIVADARLHDLRHSHASHAVMNGESLHVAGRLLGHRRATKTNRYVHLDDATLSQAAERVSLAIVRKLHRSANQAVKPHCS